MILEDFTKKTSVVVQNLEKPGVLAVPNAPNQVPWLLMNCAQKVKAVLKNKYFIPNAKL